MEFLETLETMRGERANLARMFGGEGHRAGHAAESNDYSKRLVTAVEFLADVLEGRRPSHQLQEAMTTSDFPILFGDILDRQVLASYTESPVTWAPIAKRRVVRDFRGVKLFKPLTGGAGILEEVGELAEYPEVALAEQTPQEITVSKFGRRMQFSWESGINDDLDMLRDIPDKMGRSARRTENYVATGLFSTSTGPDSTLYSTANKNLVVTGNGAATNNPILGIAGLTDAFEVFGNQVDEEGNPITTEAVTLVVPPALEVVANNILNATQIEFTQPRFGGDPNRQRTDGATPTATGEVRLQTTNWLSRRLTLIVNPLLPLIDTTTGNTAWYLFGNPNTGREALVMAFLRGWEQPSVFVKSANARRVGGGDIDPLDGDFDTDAVTYKVRHVLGSATVDPKATVASKGTASA